MAETETQEYDQFISENPILVSEENRILISSMFIKKASELGVTPFQLWDVILKTSLVHKISIYHTIKATLNFNDLGMYILALQDTDWYNDRHLVLDSSLFGSKLKPEDNVVEVKEGLRYIHLHSKWTWLHGVFVIDKTPSQHHQGEVLLCTHTKAPLGDLRNYYGFPASLGWNFYKSIRVVCGGSILFPTNKMRVAYEMDFSLPNFRGESDIRRIERVVGWIKFQKVMLKLLRFGIKYIELELPDWVFSCVKPRDLKLFYKRGEVVKSKNPGMYILQTEEVRSRVFPKYSHGIKLVKMHTKYENNWSSEYPPGPPSREVEVGIWGCTPYIDFQEWIRKKGYDQPMGD